MRRRRTVIRAFVTAVSLLLTALLAADSAAAQVVPASEHGVASIQQSQIQGEAERDTIPADCQSHRGARNPVNTPAPTVNPLHMCVCHFGPSVAPKAVAAITGSEGFSRGRTVEIPLLHQVFRC
ncbi:hypothetical protein [Streptomyces sp. ODS28]|uniref:hypothetical protein n=1 Tax=Streptomyces sp. ODS28 TaxID=3136688 RepID=UPI0031ED864F